MHEAFHKKILLATNIIHPPPSSTVANDMKYAQFHSQPYFLATVVSQSSIAIKTPATQYYYHIYHPHPSAELHHGVPIAYK